MRADIEQTSIRSINQAAFVNIESLNEVLELSLGVAVNCDNTEQIISSFTDKLDEQTLDDLMQVTQDVLQKYGKKEPDEDTTFNQTVTDTNNIDSAFIEPSLQVLDQSVNRSRRDGRKTPNMSQADISIDNEVLGRVDLMEEQNK